MHRIGMWLIVSIICLTPHTYAENSPFTAGATLASLEPHPVANHVPVLPVTGNMQTIRLGSDQLLLVSTQPEHRFITIQDINHPDTSRQLMIGAQPKVLAVQNDLLYVGYQHEKKAMKQPWIAIVDLKAMQIMGRMPGNIDAQGITFNSDGRVLLTLYPDKHQVAVYSANRGRHIKSISLSKYGKRPRAIQRSPDGMHYLVTLEASNKFLVLDRKLRVCKEVMTAVAPYGISYDEDGKHIYVATGRDKTLQVYDAATYTKHGEVQIEDACWQFSFNASSKNLMLACQHPAQILVIDTEAMSITQRLPLPGLPAGSISAPPTASNEWPTAPTIQ